MQTADSAKQFLLDRILEQASTDGITLSDIEKRMFLFAEMSPNPDWEANKLFEADCDDEACERKIAGLLRRAHESGRKLGQGEAGWRDRMQALEKEDFYGLVMVDQAGIRSISANMGYGSVANGGVLRTLVQGMLNTRVLLFVLLETLILLFAAALFSDRVPYTSSLPDALRLLLIAACGIASWLVGKAYRAFSVGMPVFPLRITQ